MNGNYLSAFKPVFLALIALICLHSACTGATPLRLTMVLSEQGGAYQEYGSALIALLAGSNITLSVAEAGKPLPDADLVIAAGMKAAMYVARSRPAAMLAVLVPKEGYAALRSDFSAQAKNGDSAYSAIYLDQPFKRQLDLVAAVLPKTVTIGVLYTARTKEIVALRIAAEARKFGLNERMVVSASNMHTALQELLVGSDVLLALPDPEVYNAATIRNILLATYRNRVPLIGFSPAYVKAGSLCAVYSTPEQVAAQSLVIIHEYAEKHVLPAAQHAKAFEVSVNEQVARSLGIDIKSVTQIRSEIGITP